MWPDATVAWPHIFDFDGRSEPAQVIIGVVALARNGEGGLGEIFSAAIAWSNSSSSQRSSGITAAGLPVNGLSANASTWKNGRLVISASSSR